MYLLDTNVISETRRLRPHGGVISWLRSAENSSLYVSAVSAAEIQTGIELTRRQAPAKAAEIEEWLEDILASFSVIPMDATIFRIWAKLKIGRSSTLYDDAMIAATAITYDLTVVTRNVRDFAGFDVPVLDPFRS